MKESIAKFAKSIIAIIGSFLIGIAASAVITCYAKIIYYTVLACWNLI